MKILVNQQFLKQTGPSGTNNHATLNCQPRSDGWFELRYNPTVIKENPMNKTAIHDNVTGTLQLYLFS